MTPTCPEAVAIAPTPTIVVSPPPGGIDHVCVEDADGYAETFVLAPPADTDLVVQLGTGADIVAYSVNAEWGELPVTGGSPAVIVLAVVTFVVGLGFGRIGRGARR
ncbi:MAG: hypothetical protein ACO3S5_12620 [Ilumatobacteraceae bacterium]